MDVDAGTKHVLVNLAMAHGYWENNTGDAERQLMAHLRLPGRRLLTSEMTCKSELRMQYQMQCHAMTAQPIADQIMTGQRVENDIIETCGIELQRVTN